MTPGFNILQPNSILQGGTFSDSSLFSAGSPFSNIGSLSPALTQDVFMSSYTSPTNTTGIGRYPIVGDIYSSMMGGLSSLGGLFSADSTLNTVYGLLAQAQSIYQGGMAGLNSTMSSLGNMMGVGNGLSTGTAGAAPGVTGSGRLQKPCSGTVTSEFGPRWGKKHKGIDIGAPTGTPIKPADKGTVIKVSNDPGGYGQYVEVDHGNGVTTLYAHCSAIHVKPGQVVGPNDVIADVGSTGHSTGPHLHFEVKENGTQVNPRKHVNF